jgi:outer membrane autotransporter protein
LPLYRQEVSLYAAVPSMALSYELQLMDSLRERVDRDVQGEEGGAWARIVARHDTRDGGTAGIYGNKGPGYSDDLSALQAGTDLYRGQHDSGTDVVGVYVALGQIAGDVKHIADITAGRDRLQNYTLGGYWTHLDSFGWYADAVAQGSGYKVKASSTRMAPLKTEGHGFAASLEGGYPVALRSGWVFVPQAQLVYRSATVNDASDEASSVSFGRADALAGRIGTEVRKGWAFGSGGHQKSLTGWLRVDVWREFTANSDVAFSTPTAPMNFHADLRRSWVGLRAGLSAQLARNVFVYASAGHDFGVNDHGKGYSGKAGLRINW